jgi:dolichyl-phosphate-mannose--protein O-mannosyl transferase
MIDGTHVTERETETPADTAATTTGLIDGPDATATTLAVRDANGQRDPDAKRPRVVIPDIIRRRLVPDFVLHDWRGWVATGWVVMIAAILRFVDLTKPKGMTFDEIYYAKEGGQLLQYGVEWRPDPAHGPGSADYVVHPPLGKWLIGAGIKIFGYNEFGWRVASAIAGTLAILIITRTARRLFRSTVLGCIAGLLMAMDGMELVLSRFALLDIFVMFFVLVAFACVVIDRDHRRARWLAAMEDGIDPAAGGRAGRPKLTWAGVPWFRLAAGVALGAGCAVKWSAIYYIPLFIALIYAWEIGARRSAGVRHPYRDTFLDETGWIVAMVVLGFSTYLASWTGWFLTDYGWDRHWLAQQGKHETPIWGALQNLWHYHNEMWDFHTHLTSSHPYQSWPWQWLLDARPVAFYWSSDPNCGAAQCAAEVLLLGTPAIWWALIPAMIGTVWVGVARRDWRALTIMLGIAAGIVPWFWNELDDRTMFFFYALPAEPFIVLAITYVLGALVTRPARVKRAGAAELTLPQADRKLYGTIFATAYLVLVTLCFWWYYPIFAGVSISYKAWWMHMLLGNKWV